MSDRKKQVFEKTLRGEPVGYDMLGRPLIEGDVVAYATGSGSRQVDIKLGKILEVTRKYKSEWTDEKVTKIRVQRVEKGWGRNNDTWVRGARASYLSNFDHVIRMEADELPERVTELFEGAADETTS